MHSAVKSHSELLHEIVRELHSVKTSVSDLVSLVAQNADLAARVASLESAHSTAQYKKAQRGVGWICPVCMHPFAHRESFKGHIMRLKDPVTDRAKCFLDPENDRHVALVAHPRYGSGDFDARRISFAEQFYQTVRSNSNSTRSSESSHSAVTIQNIACTFSLILIVTL